jgi:hypothetical protein
VCILPVQLLSGTLASGDPAVNGTICTVLSDYIQRSSDFEQPLAQRRREVVRLLDEVSRVARLSNDAEAMAVARLLEERGVVVLALRGGRLGLDDAPLNASLERAIFLVPVRGVDRLVLHGTDNGANFANVSRTGQVWASYYRTHRAIYWAAEWSIAPLWKAIIVLHEGLHAYQHLEARSPRSRAARELAAQALERRTLGGLGGSRFEALIAELARRQPDENRRPEIQSATAAALDAMFGAPISSEDEATRGTFIDSYVQQQRSHAAAAA